MQMKQLEYVRVIAENHSISRAAEALFISQQALSESLRLLEEELDFKIFNRSKKGVVLTEEGEKFLQDLNQIMPVIYGWKHLAKSNQEKRTIKIGVQYVLSDWLGNTNLVESLEMDTNMIIDWKSLKAKEILDKIELSEFHLGLVHLVNGSSAYDKLQKLAINAEFEVKTLISHSKMVVALRAEDELAEKEIICASDLYGKQIVENQEFGITANVKRIIEYTGKRSYLLPASVNMLDYILCHENVISYLPEIAIKNNVHVKNKNIVMRYLENDLEYTLSIVCNRRAMNHNSALIKKFEQYFFNFI